MPKALLFRDIICKIKVNSIKFFLIEKSKSTNSNFNLSLKNHILKA